MVSVGLQHGVPLKVLCDKLSHTRFEPSGWTGSDEMGYAKSIMDYLFRWMELRFLSGTQLPLFTTKEATSGNAGRVPNQASASISTYSTMGTRWAMLRCARPAAHSWSAMAAATSA